MKTGRAGLHFLHKRLQSVATVHPQTATAGIFENIIRRYAEQRGFTIVHGVELIFGGVFLEIRRHPDISSG